MFNLGIYGNHNASIAIAKDDKILEVIEIERFVNKKNAALYYWGIDQIVFGQPTHPHLHNLLEEIQKYFYTKYNSSYYNIVAYNQVILDDIQAVFKADRYEYCSHHVSHASCGLYQSSFNNALIVSIDGWSDERFFHIYIGEKGKELIHVYEGSTNYAVAYAIPAHYIQDIRQEDYGTGNLVYPGKIMGLAGYGKIDPSMIPKMIEFYKLSNTWDFHYNHNNFINLFGYLGISKDSRITGPAANNLAATSQYVFEKLLLEEITPFLNQYPELPLILSGGAALNVINNTRLSNIRPTFVPPNPSDCGQGIGVLCAAIKPTSPVDCTYIGPEVWDRHDLSRIVFERDGHLNSINSLADDIMEGKIFGIVRNTAENGPRALGNRSIICDPTVKDMKNILNFKIKNREYYRPFAPVVRLQDVNKYFEWDKESRHMEYCPKVREEYRSILAAVTHIDGTARIQTVTSEQNKFLYDLLTVLNSNRGIGILLNTSFNIAGKPIINTYRDALWALDNTQIDGLVLEDFIIKK